MEKYVLDRLEAYIEGQVSVDGFCGTILIAQSGKCLICRGWGLANREHLIPNRVETKFRIGSVSKQFTAAAILLLQEQCKLSINDPLNKYIPDYPNGDKIELHHLLTHTSGIPNFTNLPEFGSKARIYSPPESTIMQFKQHPLDFNPGERFFYSNSGYVVLARIVELVSGQSFGDFLDESILQPLGMYNTGSDRNEAILLQRASGYKVWGNYVHADFIDMSIMTGAGGLYSTVKDMYLWDCALYTDTFLSSESRDLMVKPHVRVNDSTSYGYGLNISNEGIIKNSLKIQQIIGHSGGIDGFMTEYQRFVDEDLTFIVMCNVHPSQPAVILKDLARIVLGEDVSIPHPHELIEMEHTIHINYTGQYTSDNKKFSPKITLDNGKLYISYEPWYKYELRLINKREHDAITCFKTVGAPGKLEFLHDEGGAVIKGDFYLFGGRIPITPVSLGSL